MEEIEFDSPFGKVSFNVSWRPLDAESVQFKYTATNIPKLLKAMPFFDIPEMVEVAFSRKNMLDLAEKLTVAANDNDFGGIPHE